MKEKIDVSKLCFVNGYLGTYDEKKNQAVVSDGATIQVYIRHYLKGELKTINFGKNSPVEIVSISDKQKVEFQYEVDKCWLYTPDMIFDELLWKRYFTGDF